MAKIGEGHVAAMGRLGLKELRNALNPSTESVADTEIGLYGTQTQGEIAQARGSYGLDADQEQSAPDAHQTTDLAANNTIEPEVAAELDRMQGGFEQSRGR